LVPICAAHPFHYRTYQCVGRNAYRFTISIRGAAQASCSILGARRRNESNPRRAAALHPLSSSGNRSDVFRMAGNEPGEVPVAVDQEQIACETKVIG
jgi:hypothetical protein